MRKIAIETNCWELGPPDQMPLKKRGMTARVHRNRLRCNVFRLPSGCRICRQTCCASASFVVTIVEVEEPERSGSRTCRRRRHPVDGQTVATALSCADVAECVRRSEVAAPVVGVVEMPPRPGHDEPAASGTPCAAGRDDAPDALALALVLDAIATLGRRALGSSRRGSTSGRAHDASPRHRAATTPLGVRHRGVVSTHWRHASSAAHDRHTAMAACVVSASGPPRPSNSRPRPAHAAPRRSCDRSTMRTVRSSHGGPGRFGRWRVISHHRRSTRYSTQSTHRRYDAYECARVGEHVVACFACCQASSATTFSAIPRRQRLPLDGAPAG